MHVAKPSPDRLVRLLAVAGLVLVVLGTVVPYEAGFDKKNPSLAVLDFDAFGSTWPYALSFLLTVVASIGLALVLQHRPAVVAGFLAGGGPMILLDFLGAYVIGPFTFSDFHPDVKAGGPLGTVGGALLLAAGLVGAEETTSEF